VRFVKQNAIAIVALVLAMTGTGIAASRYIITSTSQIKPSVLRRLSPSSVIDRIRSVAPVTAGKEQSDPLTGSTWTQGADEIDLLYGRYMVSMPSLAQCAVEPGPERAHVVLRFRLSSGAGSEISHELGAEPSTALGVLSRQSPISLYEPGTATVRKATVTASDDCTGVHGTIDSVSVDVVGLH
jgi:hypothetical protein